MQRYWPFVRGIHRPPVASPHKGQCRGAWMFSSICTWANSWANNRVTCEMRRHRAYYDLTMMIHRKPVVSRTKGQRCRSCTHDIHRSRWIPTQRPVTRSFDVFCDLRLNKRLSKQLWGWWFETPSWSLWRHCNENKSVCIINGILCIFQVMVTLWTYVIIAGVATICFIGVITGCCCCCLDRRKYPKFDIEAGGPPTSQLKSFKIETRKKEYTLLPNSIDQIQDSVSNDSTDSRKAYIQSSRPQPTFRFKPSKKQTTTNGYAILPYWVDHVEGDAYDDCTDFLSQNYINFKNRHVVRPDRMPNSLNGWNNLMHQRGLSDRDRNTFIADMGYSDDVFAVPTWDGNYMSNRWLIIVDLKKNKSTGRYGVGFQGPAIVEATLDNIMRPVHFAKYHT